MSPTSVTLRGFFASSDVAQDRLESSPEVAALRSALSLRGPKGAWPGVRGGIIGSIDELMDIPFAEIAAGAWDKYQVLRKYADPKKYAPDEVIEIPLATHTIRSEHKPYLEILVDDKVMGKVDFDIALALTLEGAVVSIRDGKIREIRVGSCEGSGSVKCENIAIAERKTRTFQLPGSIPLGDGISVAPRDGSSGVSP